MFYFTNNNFSEKFNENLKILDLTPKHANLDEIKKAYHLKAKKYHPDKGGSNDDFITIHKAYDFLMNNSIFLLKNDNQNNNNNLNINNNNNEKKDNNNNNDLKNKKLKTKNITHPIEITLKEAFYGKKKLIKLKRNRICPKCKDLNNNNNNNICSECNNKKYTNQTKEIELKLKPGIFNGCKIILKGESEEYLNFIPGDVIFEIKIKEEKNIKREGSDLFINYSIPLIISLCGGIINIKLFDKNFNVNVNCIIHPGMKKTLIGKGMPFYDNNKMFGNLHIKFNVDFPKKLEEWQKNLILNAFNNNLKNNSNNNNNNNKNKEGKNKKKINNKIQFNLNENINLNNNNNLNKEILYLKDFKEENLNKSYFYNNNINK